MVAFLHPQQPSYCSLLPPLLLLAAAVSVPPGVASFSGVVGWGRWLWCPLHAALDLLDLGGGSGVHLIQSQISSIMQDSKANGCGSTVWIPVRISWRCWS